jgi:hypothetical protein
MPRSLMSRFLHIALGLCLVSCIPDAFLKEHNDLRDTVRKQGKLLEGHEVELAALRTERDNTRRERSADKFCKDPKAREFLASIEHDFPGSCSQVNTSAAMTYMKNYAYAISLLHPHQTVQSLHPGRLGDIKFLLLPEKIVPSTHILILVQPYEDKEVAQREALRVAEGMIPIVQGELKERLVVIVGPHLLPCNLRSVPKKTYMRPEDTPYPSEPPEGKPAVRIWVFRSPC